MEFSQETLARLGLADGASPEDIQKKIGELADKLAELTKPAPVVEVAEPVPVTAKPAVDLSAEIKAEAAKIAEAAERERKIAAAVEKALSDGKVTTAQRDSATAFATANLEGFEKFVEAAPVVVPVAKDKAAPKPASKTKRSAADKIGEAAAGLDPARYALHLAALAYAEENNVDYTKAALAVSRR
jgi:hypothetical protein